MDVNLNVEVRSSNLGAGEVFQKKGEKYVDQKKKERNTLQFAIGMKATRQLIGIGTFMSKVSVM